MDPRDGDVETATYIRGQAQRCFSFVDCKGLADATVDVETAVRNILHRVHRWKA